MKKILFIAVLSLFVVTANAQFGIKVGVNFSSWHGDDVDDNDVDGLIGFYLGGFYNIAVTDHFAVEPQLLYSTTGVKSDNGDIKDALSSINLTALAKYVTPSGFFLGTGPELGFLVSAKEKEDGEPDVDIKDQLNSTQLYWAFALGYDTKGGFGIYARYNLGLSNVIEDVGGISIDAKQSVIQVGFRWTFNQNNSQ